MADLLNDYHVVHCSLRISERLTNSKTELKMTCNKSFLSSLYNIYSGIVSHPAHYFKTHHTMINYFCVTMIG